MPAAVPGPTSHVYFSQRLRLHYVDWGNDDAPALIMLHGGRDHCRSWDWVAQELRDRYHVIAPDLRGHGDSQWVLGAAYAPEDYVYDLAQLIHQKQLAPVRIIAHSLGGAIALRYAGVYPDTVHKLVAVEGLMPPMEWIAKRSGKPTAERMREWIDMLREMAGRVPRRYPTIDAAVQRMQAANKRLTPAQARHLTVHGVNQNEDGTYTWKFDNYERAFSPRLFNEGQARELWSRVACPTLLIEGKDSRVGDSKVVERVRVFPNARVLNVDEAGHWVHHDQLELFVRESRAFLAD